VIGGRWIAVAGDLHGALAVLERLLGRFERASGGRVELVLQVGDLELPEDARTRRDLVFIGGNHDTPREVAPGFHSLGRAGAIERHGVRIGGLSGTYHPRLSEEPRDGKAAPDEHCTRDDVAVLLAEKLDILLLHEWPEGIAKGTRGNPHGKLLIERLQPRWAFCGHRHAAFAAELGATRVRCLADVPKGGEESVAFLRLPDLVEAAPLGELETFARLGERR
jgi:hypothetical protein